MKTIIQSRTCNCEEFNRDGLIHTCTFETLNFCSHCLATNTYSNDIVFASSVHVQCICIM